MSESEIVKDRLAAYLAAKKVTDVYIDYDMEKVDEANRLVVDNLNAAGGLPGLLFAK